MLIMDEVFYEFKEIKSESDLSTNIKIEIILHFLAKVGETLILYETRQTVPKSVNSDNDTIVINTLQKIIDQINQFYCDFFDIEITLLLNSNSIKV